MSHRTLVTRDGSAWVPQYLLSIDAEKCIGCGRCIKVCPQDVLELKGVNEDGELVDPFGDDDDIERKITVIANEGVCIGCSACATVCGTKAQTHAPLADAA